MKITKLRNKGKSLRRKYPNLDIQTLENIAKDEYNVTAVIYTPLAWKQAKAVTRFADRKRFIFYHDYEDYTPIALAHEIGHFEAGHHNGYRPNFLVRELEADSFAGGF